MATGPIKKTMSVTVINKATSETLPVTLTAGSGKRFDFSIAETGKTPLGIVGVTGSGTGNCAFQDFYLANSTTATVYLKNISTSSISITALYIRVLYATD